MTQNETQHQPSVERQVNSLRLSRRLRFAGFTLTELLVVIAIIAVLAAIALPAAYNAYRRAQQARITMEMQQVALAIDEFKTKTTFYPPNAVNFSGSPSASVRSDFDRALRSAYPRHTETAALIDKLTGIPTTDKSGNSYLEDGMTGAEALVFWLSGFSDDTQNPISGPGGPSFDPADPEVLENRNWEKGFGFDLSRLGPRDASGRFAGRSIQYEDPTGAIRQINFWVYIPSGSQQSAIYFDTSRATPATRIANYGSELKSSTNPKDALAPIVFALRQPLETITIPNPTIAQTKYVNQGKYQLLHSGLDDIWGDFAPLSSDPAVNTMASLTDADGNPVPLLAPEGPFTGDLADTLLHTNTGTLADSQE